MQICFLGTGAATSYPLPFCDCANCRQARQHGGKSLRMRSSLLVNEDLLIDMGPDFASAMLRFSKEIPRIRYLLQTHAHSDHFDAGHLVTRSRAYGCILRQALTITASQTCLNLMSEGINAIEGYTLFEKRCQEDMLLEMMALEHGHEARLGRYRVLALESLHDPQTGSQIYLIQEGAKKILYAVDSPALSPAASALLQGQALDLLVYEQTFGSGFESESHMNEDGLLKQLEGLHESKAVTPNTQIFITHISHEGNAYHEALAERCRALGYQPAFDGLEIEI